MKTKTHSAIIAVIGVLCSLFTASAFAGANLTVNGAFEQCIYDAVPLDGAWEMSYRSNSWDSVEYPQFKGVFDNGTVTLSKRDDGLYMPRGFMLIVR